ncbi:HAUS augmin-like complex subunit 4 [Pleurodeles waltl]|uniref:HAUS augmin-like complex subunit 4 n=1 Tax=Pleurodeles waltl TaxID=8319 RepID=UPI0037095BBB
MMPPNGMTRGWPQRPAAHEERISGNEIGCCRRGRSARKIPQEVCSQIPLYHLIEDDLKQYSELTKLLLEVSQQFDESGLSLDLGVNMWYTRS